MNSLHPRRLLADILTLKWIVVTRLFHWWWSQYILYSKAVTFSIIIIQSIRRLYYFLRTKRTFILKSWITNAYAVNSLYRGHCRDLGLVSSFARVRNTWVYFSQTPVSYFHCYSVTSSACTKRWYSCSPQGHYRIVWKTQGSPSAYLSQLLLWFQSLFPTKVLCG